MSEVRSTTGAPAIDERAAGKETVALNLLLGMRAFGRQSDAVYKAMGLICGIEMLFLGFFITYQVVARKIGWAMAPATDVMSGYILAMSATWAFSYSLRSGAHVRIDALLPFMGQRTRWLADFLALGAVAFFTSVTAWKIWVTIINNYERHTLTNDYPLTPIWIPKLVIGIGFSLLGFTALQMMATMVGEGLLPRWHKRLGGGEIVAAEKVVLEEAPTIA
jgi:TRAP-type mannitol/chloroaromatic compound transport system permease small subunit